MKYLLGQISRRSSLKLIISHPFGKQKLKTFSCLDDVVVTEDQIHDEDHHGHDQESHYDPYPRP